MKAILQVRNLSRRTREQETAVEHQDLSPDRLLLAPLLYFSPGEKMEPAGIEPQNAPLLAEHDPIGPLVMGHIESPV